MGVKPRKTLMRHSIAAIAHGSGIRGISTAGTPDPSAARAVNRRQAS
jgi:hypothetical protein